MTTPLFAGLLLSAKASLQRLTYADGVYLSPLEVLDDENRSALSARSAAPVVRALHAWAEEMEITCRRLGVGYTRVLTSTPLEEFIFKDLRRVGVVGR